MQLPMHEVAEILRSSYGASDRIVQGYSIDSRTISSGQLFFAIRGPRFDGHQFVKQAFEAGAVGAVVEEKFLPQAPAPLIPALIPVGDTSEALQRLARAVRRRWGCRLVAVTGSTGKSTTKEMIATALATRFVVHKSPGNLNNQYGLPLALLALEPKHETAVLELAMSGAGEIGHLARIAEPEVGVVTNVAAVHLQFFDSVESIAQAKRELIENLKPPATAVLNHDDPRVRRFAEGFKGRVLTFGFDAGADFRAVSVKAKGSASEFQLEERGRESGVEFQVRLAGRHNVANSLAAIATANVFGIAPTDLQKALAGFQNLPQRSEILTLPGPVTILNDCYNSNPLAMQQMLETLGAWPDAHRRIVVAGEMLELGASSPEWHRKVGEQCAEISIDWLLVVQGDARFFIEGATGRGLPSERAHFFSTAGEAAEFCKALLEPGDVVLVKGSRGVHLEKVTELLASQTEVDTLPAHRKE